MANFISGIISLSIGVIMMASVFMTTVHDTNTSTWSASEVALWSVVGLVGVVGILYGALNVFGVL
jgi:hypothetical protein